jgi:hypothetical protein
MCVGIRSGADITMQELGFWALCRYTMVFLGQFALQSFTKVVYDGDLKLSTKDKSGQVVQICYSARFLASVRPLLYVNVISERAMCGMMCPKSVHK